MCAPLSCCLGVLRVLPGSQRLNKTGERGVASRGVHAAGLPANSAARDGEAACGLEAFFFRAGNAEN